MKKKNKRLFNKIVMILLVIGAINWGLFGVFNFNLIFWALGSGFVAKIIYAIIGLVGAVGLWDLIKK